MILRPGFITEEMLAVAMGEITKDETLLREDSGQAPKAPGMKYRHYAPKGELVIVRGAEEAVTACINEKLRAGRAEHKRTGVIATDETIGRYEADVCFSVGKRNSAKAAAENLYRILRACDDEGVELIFSECPACDDEGVGAAVMNRLLKAAGHRIIDV